jgi:hypothetical protein
LVVWGTISTIFGVGVNKVAWYGQHMHAYTAMSPNEDHPHTLESKSASIQITLKAARLPATEAQHTVS